jgi:hypothetical protein
MFFPLDVSFSGLNSIKWMVTRQSFFISLFSSINLNFHQNVGVLGFWGYTVGAIGADPTCSEGGTHAL